MAVPGKQYGLILPQKKGLIKTTGLKKHCVFGDDSEDETSVGESLQKEAAKKKTMRQTQLEMKKALEQDSTVYDYDAVYDDIQQQRLDNSRKVLSEAEKKPKYIHQLMKAVENRKKEQERREERKIQKEREAEGEQFADKEAYVTSAYKLKLQEQKEEEERERREAAIEAALDVRKQRDLSGFYRHLLNQTIGEEAIPDRSASKSQSSEDQKIPEASQTSSNNTLSPGSDGEDDREEKPGFSKSAPATSTQSKRHYRQRSPSSGSGDDERERERRKKRERETDKRRSQKRDEDRDSRSHRSRRDAERDAERQDRRKERSSKDGAREKERRRSRDSEKHERKDKDDGEEKRMRDKEERKMEDEEDADKNKEKDDGEEKRRRSKEERKMEDEEVADKNNEVKNEGEEKVNKFAKRSTEQTMTSARDRYLARQMARSVTKSYIEREED
uniref:nuclear speckle splicing regulatory protein 1 isoform X1 n=2 Tax=Doryrhamphus excisus TaxID=161450 RepID=UPI0025AE2B5F|nr:nuclear speckle splicing regulatory protein 1 isoform X1 [Doryrhamphus excisus]